MPNMVSRVVLILGLCIASMASVTAGVARAQIGTLASVGGTVVDLSRDSAGRILYCTLEGEVGRITTGGSVSVLATAATGPFPQALRGVVETPTGDVAVVDSVGDIYRLPGGSTPALKVYSDLYMILEPTDLMVDAAGNYVVASQTPSSGTRALNWISGDGARWSYYLVKHLPVAMAADPLTGNLLMADSSGGGAIRIVDVADASHPTVPLDTITLAGFTPSAFDGDLAADTSGNVLMVAGGTVHRFDRAFTSSSPIATGLPALRGLAIAASSGSVPSASGWSAYVASGSTPTSIREIGNVGAPASVIAPSLGTVPNRGISVPVFFGMNTYELAADRNGDLLVGGDLWGAGFAVKRISTSTLALTTVASAAQGISGRVEGITVSSDGTIHALTSDGAIHRVVENPFQLTTVFADPLNQVVIGKDLALDRDGNFWIANRTGYGTGNLLNVSPAGTASSVLTTPETRGVCGDPFSGSILVSRWHNAGFVGTIDRYDPISGTLAPLPGFSGMNYSNAGVWGDGDAVVDVEGNVYTCSEDDFSVYKYERATGKLFRIASGYLDHLSGIAIARSTPGSGSTTGWSLFVSEFNYLWEIPSVPPAAPSMVDPSAPPLIRSAGSLSSALGTPRAVVKDPGGPSLLVSTSTGRIARVDPVTKFVATVAGAAQGLSGDLTALGVLSTGAIVTASRNGMVYRVDPFAGWAVSLLYSNPGGTLTNVRGLAVDGLDRIILCETQTAATVGRLHRLDGGVLTTIAFTARCIRAAVDPLTADLFVTERGSVAENVGEILRVETLSSPVAAGHFRHSTFTTYRLAADDGGICFDASGNFFVAAAFDGRAFRVDRATGTRTIAQGNHFFPVGAVLATGTAGVASPQGTSLFVLDGATLWERGVSGVPAGAPPSTNPGLAGPADLRVHGSAVLGASTSVTIRSPADANRLYLAVASLSGKIPGLPLGPIFGTNDPRAIPNNPDDVWGLVNYPSILPDFVNTLDASGASPATMSIILPNDPSLLGLKTFLDLAWISFDPAATSGVATVGGTAQLYLGN